MYFIWFMYMVVIRKRKTVVLVEDYRSDIDIFVLGEGLV